VAALFTWEMPGPGVSQTPAPAPTIAADPTHRPSALSSAEIRPTTGWQSNHQIGATDWAMGADRPAGTTEHGPSCASPSTRADRVGHQQRPVCFAARWDRGQKAASSCASYGPVVGLETGLLGAERQEGEPRGSCTQ